MQEGAPSESSPRDAHVVESLGSAPLCEGLFAQLHGHGTSALVLLAHDMHAPLAVFAGAAAARHGLYDLDLFAGTGVLDKMPDVDDAISAGVRAQALETGVERF
jgi:hypothetical protein